MSECDVINITEGPAGVALLCSFAEICKCNVSQCMAGEEVTQAISYSLKHIRSYRCRDG